MRRRSVIIAGVVLSVALAGLISPFASSAPDGLERVAEAHGIAAAESPAWSAAPAPDYLIPGVASPVWSTGLAGVAGTLAVFALAWVAGRLLHRRPVEPIRHPSASRPAPDRRLDPG